MLTDTLGSTNVITRDTGEAEEYMSFFPFGEGRDGNDWSIPKATPSAITDHGFTGHLHLDVLGIIHMQGRIYDYRLGRFLSADPYVQNPYDPQCLNRYSYCRNNPLRYVDPSGYLDFGLSDRDYDHVMNHDLSGCREAYRDDVLFSGTFPCTIDNTPRLSEDQQYESMCDGVDIGPAITNGIECLFGLGSISSNEAYGGISGSPGSGFKVEPTGGYSSMLIQDLSPGVYFVERAMLGTGGFRPGRLHHEHFLYVHNDGSMEAFGISSEDGKPYGSPMKLFYTSSNSNFIRPGFENVNSQPADFQFKEYNATIYQVNGMNEQVFLDRMGLWANGTFTHPYSFGTTDCQYWTRMEIICAQGQKGNYVWGY